MNVANQLNYSEKKRVAVDSDRKVKRIVTTENPFNVWSLKN